MTRFRIPALVARCTTGFSPGTTLATATFAFLPFAANAAVWKKHVLFEGARVQTVSVGDFTGDGVPDAMSSAAGRTILFVGPDLHAVTIHEDASHVFLHSVGFDVDGDGDLDFVAARHRNPGLIFWFEQPADALRQSWKPRLISDQLNGIHSLAIGDMDRDGRPDLLATSALEIATPFPRSLVWFRAPPDPRSDTAAWQPVPFAHRDAPGETHYLATGDINGDGRLDVLVAAKSGRYPEGSYFAWWEGPARDPAVPWRRHLIPGSQEGATHIYPVDVDGDNRLDLVASRGHAHGVLWLKGPDWTERPIHTEIDQPHALLVADLDGDGDSDVAQCANGSKAAWWYANDGSGIFRQELVTANQEAYDIRAHDMDGDGDLDLIIAGNNSNNVVWCENPALR